jgi:TM2 domain-containing membrane protein YozV
VDGRQYGPASVEDLNRYIADNRVNAQTLIKAEGSSEWKAIGLFPEFACKLKSVPPLSLPPVIGPESTTNAVRSSNKIAAGICGVLLGTFGIHKFILGYTRAGLIMLLVSVLSCFILSPIVSIVGIIEGIVYLCKSDEEFARTYVDGEKEWF